MDNNLIATILIINSIATLLLGIAIKKISNTLEMIVLRLYEMEENSVNTDIKILKALVHIIEKKESK